MLGTYPEFGESGGVGVGGQAPPDNFDPGLGVTAGGDVDGEPEPVQQLRTQFPLLGVHRADQDEACGVTDGHRVALDVIATHRRGVQQHVDQMVG